MRLLALSLVVLVGCRSGAESRPEGEPSSVQTVLLAAAARTSPAFAARRLMEVCWPSRGESPQRFDLTFIREAGALKDVVFQSREGAPNSVGRCLQEVAWLYPWPASDIPDTLSVGPPLVRPSGWVVLSYVTLVSERSFPPTRGLLNPAPLVRACLENGAGMRPSLRFRVKTQPVQISPFSELSNVSHPDDRSTQPELAVTDSERCVEAVLASTVYPGTRPVELDFSDLNGAPPAAAATEVAAYFAPRATAAVNGMLESASAQAGIAGLKPEVSKCWEAALGRRAGLSGGRTFRIRVLKNGAVGFAHVIPDRSVGGDGEAVDFLLDRCLLQALAATHFQPPVGDDADFSYAWVFARRG